MELNVLTYNNYGLPEITADDDSLLHFVVAFNDVAETVHDTAVEKGWWDDNREDGTCIALMHSELSEALEALRNNAVSDKLPEFHGVEEELADTIIRIMDYAEHNNLRVAEALEAKVKYNKNRTYKHGGKKF